MRDGRVCSVDLYEYQGRELFARHGLPVLDGGVATMPEEARAIAERLGGRVVVKAQVKVGGRGKAGGMEIEQVAEEAPEKVVKEPIDAIIGVDEAKARDIVTRAGFPVEVADQVTAIAVKLWQAFVAEDATLVEVNPLARVVERRPAGLAQVPAHDEGKVLLLDAKVTFDDNATFRHPDHEAWADRSAVDPLEQRAKERALNYVKLDGEVGIIGNGAGLVMSTLDVVAYAGEKHG